MGHSVTADCVIVGLSNQLSTASQLMECGATNVAHFGVNRRKKQISFISVKLLKQHNNFIHECRCRELFSPIKYSTLIHMVCRVCFMMIIIIMIIKITERKNYFDLVFVVVDSGKISSLIRNLFHHSVVLRADAHVTEPLPHLSSFVQDG